MEIGDGILLRFNIGTEEQRKTHYNVSGGPIIVTLHSKRLLSSTRPAENPSTGFLQRSRETNHGSSSEEGT